MPNEPKSEFWVDRNGRRYRTEMSSAGIEVWMEEDGLWVAVSLVSWVILEDNGCQRPPPKI